MIEWIDQNLRFKEFLDAIPKEQVVSMDTEFDSANTYYPTLALLQIGLDEENAALIDPLAITDWQPLAQFLADPQRRKVFFSGVNDMPILVRVCGGTEKCIPQSIFDAQIANGFMGGDQSMSLKKIIAQELGIELDKSETRSDWLQRPLTQSQLDYAADDVKLLPKIAAKQQAAMEANGNWEAFQDEMNLFSQEKLYQDPPLDNCWQRLVSRRPVNNPCVLQRIAALATWREECARKENIPRERIISDGQIHWLAEVNPKNIRDMERMPNFHRSNRTFLLLSQALEQLRFPPNLEISQEPLYTAPDLKEKIRNCSDQLIKYAQKRSIQRQISPTLVLTRKEATAIAFAKYHQFPIENYRSLTGWRKEVLGPEFMEILK